jgi:hypothetical protein
MRWKAGITLEGQARFGAGNFQWQITSAIKCFRALIQCHADHACRNATTQNADLCGLWIANRFAQEATRSLSQDELAQLLEFLRTIPRHAALESSQALHLPSFMLLGQESLNREP